MARSPKASVGSISTTAGKDPDIQVAEAPFHPPAFMGIPRQSLRQQMEQSFQASWVLKNGQAKLDAMLENDPDKFLDYMLKFMPKEPAVAPVSSKSIEEMLDEMRVINQEPTP